MCRGACRYLDWFTYSDFDTRARPSPEPGQERERYLPAGFYVTETLTKTGRVALTGEEKRYAVLLAQEKMMGVAEYVPRGFELRTPDEPPPPRARPPLLSPSFWDACAGATGHFFCVALAC
jgi:hypothetical protein